MAFSCVLFMEPPLLLLPIHFPSVADLDDEHNQFLVFDRVDDPVLAVADSVEVIGTGQFLGPVRPWIIFQGFNAPLETDLDLLRQTIELTLGGSSELYPVLHRRRLQP